MKSASSSSQSINFSDIAQKLRNPDKDFRFMGLSDLLNALNDRPTLKIDSENESRIVSHIVHILQNDSSGDVKGIALKSLPVLVSRISDANVNILTDALTNGISDKRDEARDICNIGLKSILSSVSPDQQPSFVLVARKLCTRLMQNIQGETSNEAKQESLDVFGELLKYFGGSLALEHEKILTGLVASLYSSRANFRKRSIAPISNLVPYLVDANLSTLMESVLENLKKNSNKDTQKTIIQLIASISRTSGSKLSRFLPQIIPLLEQSMNSSDDDEVKEFVLQAYESIVLRCARDVTPYIDSLISIAVANIKYDPNYVMDDEDEDEDIQSDSELDGDDGDYSDDEDISWKVRRFSTKLLSCICSSRSDILGSIFERVFSILVARFLEREESVRVEVLSTFTKLIHLAHMIGKSDSSTSSKLTATVHEQIGSIVKSMVKTIKSGMQKTKPVAFSLLRGLSAVVPECLNPHLPQLTALGLSVASERSTNAHVKLEIIAFAQSILPNSQNQYLISALPDLFSLIVLTSKDAYYKIVADSIRCGASIIRLLGISQGVNQAPFLSQLQELFKNVFEKAKSQDADQEVKDAAITGLSLLLTNTQGAFSGQVNTCIPLFVERLKNEVTRVSSLKAIDLIGKSTLNISSFVPAIIDEATSFLRKSNRTLRQVTLQVLETLIRVYGSQITPNQYLQLMTDISMSISESDLHITYLSAQLLTTVSTTNKAIIPIIYDKVMPVVFTVSQSSLLQGQALEGILRLLEVLVQSNDPKANFVVLLANFLSILNSSSQPLTKPAISNIAQCIAVLCTSATGAQSQETITKLITGLQEAQTPKLSYIVSLGEIGRRSDLSGYGNIYNVVGAFLDDSSDDLRLASSLSLGHIAIGNLQFFLPVLIREIQSRPKNQYMLMHSVREVLVRFASVADGPKLVESHIEQIIDLLGRFYDVSEEGTKAIVAECLGKLILLKYERTLPYLQQLLGNPSASTRAVVISSIKFAILEKPHSVDSALEQVLPLFFGLLEDSDLNVQKASLQTLNYVIHYKPKLIRPIMRNVIPIVYRYTAVNKSLIRFVDLGPFKHEIDDGLDIRKAAFTCISTMLDRVIDQLVMAEYIPIVVAGLKDKPDIQTLNHVVITKLCAYVPSAVIVAADSFVENLSATVQTRPKENAVKQEIERIEEMKRSALRAVDAIIRAAEGEQLPPAFATFVDKVVKSKEIAPLYEQVRADRERLGSD